jgi:phosphatidylserine/phosphatidylglycerophosphate/cardiolipin synthase-like enzyme
MMHIESVSFARIFTAEFGMMWGNGKRGNFGLSKTYRGPESISVDGKKITVQFSPTSQKYNWEESTNGLMANELSKATKSIKAALFVFSDQKLADVIYDRYKKRADVGIIIEPKFAYRDYSELLDVLGVEIPNKNCAVEPDNNPWKSPLAEAGMARLPGGDVLHHKFAVIDNDTVIMGSQNWSDSANFINDETLIVVHDSSIADKYTREYNRIKQSAVLGIPAQLKNEIRQREESCQGRIH